jgi:hypothetical protein
MGRPRTDPLQSNETPSTPTEPEEPQRFSVAEAKALADKGELPPGAIIEGSPEELEQALEEEQTKLAVESLAEEPLPVVEVKREWQEPPPAEGVTLGPAKPAEEEEPPEPVFVIGLNRFGPGAHSVKFVDGTPVGVWLAKERPDADPAAVHAELAALGLPEQHCAEFAERRARRDDARSAIAQMVAENPDAPVSLFAGAEAQRDTRMEPVRAAFIKGQKQKGEK